MVWTGFANVENEPNPPPFDVIEREQFRQCDVFGYGDRSVSSQERVNVREEVQAVLRRPRMIMNRRRQHRKNHLIIMTRNGRIGNE
jgi:hypothetical protein